PLLWNIFMGDLQMPPDLDDLKFGAIVIAIMAQADDLLLASLSDRGMQRKLDTLTRWCAINFIDINLVKSVILILGRLVFPYPRLVLAGSTLEVKSEEIYVGVTIRTGLVNPFEKHYKVKASSARYAAHRIMAIQDRTGTLPPKALKTLFMAWVDCYLIQGCEICPDAQENLIKELSEVQIRFIRRILNVHNRCMIIPLYTETGIMPLRIRRV
ncbi:hypothetical protein C8J56DRAFT_708540, partial [Mycena floridula]